MSIFNKLFKRDDNIRHSDIQSDIAVTSDGIDNTDSMPSDEYTENLRGLAKQIMPKVEDNVASQKNLLSSLCQVFANLTSLDAEGDMKYWNRFESGEEPGWHIIGNIAFDAANIMSRVSDEWLDEIFSETDFQKLIVSWGVLDFYIYMLKPEYSRSLTDIQQKLTVFLYRNDIKIQREQIPKLEVAEREHYEKLRAGASPEELTKLRKDIGKYLLESESVWVAFDTDCKFSLPYVGMTGRMEIFSKEEYALKAKEYFAASKNINIDIKKIEKESVKGFFESCVAQGLTNFNLDNGIRNTDMCISEFFTVNTDYIIDSANSALRACFIQKLQLINRYNKPDSCTSKPKKEAGYAQVLESVGQKAFGLLCSNVIYVLIEGASINGVTLYSKAAYDAAYQKAVDLGVDDSMAMTAPGDTVVGVADNTMKLGVVNINNLGSFACAFTHRDAAAKVREKFINSGTESNIVAVTFAEIINLICQCDGLAFDIDTCTYLYSKNELEYMKEKLANL